LLGHQVEVINEVIVSVLFVPFENPQGIAPVRFKRKSSASSTAISCDSTDLRFCNGHDIRADDDCNATNSTYTTFDSFFENTAHIDGKCILDDPHTFTIQEIEVFAMCAQRMQNAHHSTFRNFSSTGLWHC
jgi:hypothetical protein